MILKCVMLLTLTCRNLAVTWLLHHLNSLPLFRKPKNVEIPKRVGVRAVVVDSSNNLLLTLQDFLNPDLSFRFGKMQVIKYNSRFSRFLLLRQDYSKQTKVGHFWPTSETPFQWRFTDGRKVVQDCMLVG